MIGHVVRVTTDRVHRNASVRIVHDVAFRQVFHSPVLVVPEAEADALFEFICEKANIDREGGGVVLQHALVTATPFALPEGVAEEET